MHAYSDRLSRGSVAVLAIAMAAHLSAQSIERDVLAAAGGLSQAGSVCLAYTVGEVVVDGGTSGPTVVTAGFEQASSYDYWSSARGLLLGPLGDSDYDGVNNLLEYAFGTDPLNSGSQVQPQVSIGPGGKLYLTISKGAAAGDLIWTAEVSTDLAAWESQGVSIALNDATTFSALYTGVASTAFLRLRISIPGSK